VASVMSLVDDPLLTGFRAAMRRLASSVAIVTAQGDTGPVGMAATSITSLTMDPPSVLVCVNQASSLHACIAADTPLSINLLSRYQQEVSMAFGGGVPNPQRFEVGLWENGEHNLPILRDAQANLCCVVDRLVEYGTHTIIIAQVESVACCNTVNPLIYQDGVYL